MNPEPRDKFTRCSADEAAGLRANASRRPRRKTRRALREFVQSVYASSSGSLLFYPCRGIRRSRISDRAISLPDGNPRDQLLQSPRQMSPHSRERETGSIDAFQILTTTCATFLTVTPVLFTRSEYRLFLHRVPRIR